MSQHTPRLGSDHQRVHLVSVYQNAHLHATEPKDSERRCVATGKSISLFHKEWRLVPTREGNHYKIVHHHLNEPLVAGSDAFAYDGDQRTVLTWIPGPSGSNLLWDIKHAPEGHYLIESVEYGEYLYSSNCPSAGRVYTWRKKGEPLNEQFYWDIININ